MAKIDEPAHEAIDIAPSKLTAAIEAWRKDIDAAAYYVNVLRECPWEEAAEREDFVAVHRGLQKIVDLLNCAGSHAVLIEQEQNDKSE